MISDFILADWGLGLAGGPHQFGDMGACPINSLSVGLVKQ